MAIQDNGRLFQEVESGTYETELFEKYYKVVIENPGNVFVQPVFYTGVGPYVYDMGLQRVGEFEAPVDHLDAGHYYIQIDHNGSYYKQTSIYIPSSESFEGLPSLTSGSYPEDDYNNLYSLSLDYGGMVTLSQSGDSPSFDIYDKQLNLVMDGYGVNGPFYLDDGDYVVHTSYNGNPDWTSLNAYIQEDVLDHDDGDQATDLPDAGLSFPNLEDGQLDFLIAMYVGSFGRAPEYEGLEYWATQSAMMLADGKDFGTVTQEIGVSFYLAGTENGEAGTDMNTTGFVTLAYRNALGREPDEDGLTYWVNQIETGNMNRGQFMSYFVSAALANGEDGDHITNSVAVAEFIAQEHVSGQDELDMALLELVNDVAGEQSAIDLIDTITQQYPAPEVVGVSLAEVSYDIA